MFRNFIRKFHSCENGATAVEYGLISALIAVACISILTLVGQKNKTVFEATEHILSSNS